jgi:pentatricopeptide repeat protein
MLVIHKPSGMIMQFVAGSVENAVVFHLKTNASLVAAASGGLLPVLPPMTPDSIPFWPWKSQESFEGIVHRIDKDTSGILVVAKHPLAAKSLHASFQERRVHKTYLAIAVGLPTSTNETEPIDQTLQQSPQQRHLLPLVVEKPHLQRLSKEIKKCGCNADKALELLNQSSDPNAVCFNAAISVCKRAGERDKALSIFDSMKQRGVTPNTKCFMKAINLCAKGTPPLYEKAMELIRYMEECNLPRNLYSVSSAISACGRAGQLEPALELLRLVVEEESAGTDHSNSNDGMLGCFKAAIGACERCGGTQSALALKDQLRTMIESRQDVIKELQSRAWMHEDIVVDAPIGRMGSRRRLMGILPTSQGGREARSIISPLAFDGTLSLVRVVIETGRTHQIRVHMASVLGCPLAGDHMYNDRDSHNPIQRVERCMLHASKITLPHPITGAMLTISCPPPPDFFTLADTITRASL